MAHWVPEISEVGLKKMTLTSKWPIMPTCRVVGNTHTEFALSAAIRF